MKDEDLPKETDQFANILRLVREEQYDQALFELDLYEKSIEKMALSKVLGLNRMFRETRSAICELKHTELPSLDDAEYLKEEN